VYYLYLFVSCPSAPRIRLPLLALSSGHRANTAAPQKYIIQRLGAEVAENKAQI
jgi:hypothetical protein